MRRRNSIISACLTLVLAGIIVFSMKNDFGPVTDMPDEETPLIGDYGIDFSYENYDQQDAESILNEIVTNLVDASEAPDKEKQPENENIPIRGQDDAK